MLLGIVREERKNGGRNKDKEYFGRLSNSCWCEALLITQWTFYGTLKDFACLYDDVPYGIGSYLFFG